MITRFQRKLAIYLVLVVQVFIPGLYLMLGGFVASYSGYLGALVTSMPVWFGIGGQLYAMHAVFEDSFEHDMDVDWWMAVLFLGPFGVLLYYLVREGYL